MCKLFKQYKFIKKNSLDDIFIFFVFVFSTLSKLVNEIYYDTFGTPAYSWGFKTCSIVYRWILIFVTDN